MTLYELSVLMRLIYIISPYWRTVCMVVNIKRDENGQMTFFLRFIVLLVYYHCHIYNKFKRKMVIPLATIVLVWPHDNSSGMFNSLAVANSETEVN